MTRPWAVVLYERYTQLYGEPIEKPISNDRNPEDVPAGSSPQTQERAPLHDDRH